MAKKKKYTGIKSGQSLGATYINAQPLQSGQRLSSYTDKIEQKIAEKLFGKDYYDTPYDDSGVFETIVSQYKNDKDVKKNVDKSADYLRELYTRQVNSKEIQKLQKQLESPILSDKKKQEIQQQINQLKYDNSVLDESTLQRRIDNSPGIKTAATVGQALNKTAGAALKFAESIPAAATTITADLASKIDRNTGDRLKEMFAPENRLSGIFEKNAQDMSKYAYNTTIPFTNVEAVNIPADLVNMLMLIKNPVVGYSGIAADEMAETINAGGSYERALVNAAVKTGTALGTETIGGYLPGKSIKNAFTRGVWNTVGTEVLEENIDNTINAVYDFYTQNPTGAYRDLEGMDAFKQYLADTRDTTVSTFIVSLLGGSGEITNTIKNNTQNKKALNKQTKQETTNIETKDSDTDLDTILNAAVENMTPEQKVAYENNINANLKSDAELALAEEPAVKPTETEELIEEVKPVETTTKKGEETKVEKTEAKVEEKPKTETINKGVLSEKDGKEIIFYRYHPDYANNISDNFNYDNANNSNKTGMGYAFSDGDTYVKGKDSKDVIKTKINAKSVLNDLNSSTVTDTDIDKLNAIINKYNDDMPGVEYGATDKNIIDSINMVTELLKDDIGGNKAHQAYIEMYNALGKDGYIIHNDDGTRTLSVNSIKNMTDLVKNQPTKTEKLPKKEAKIEKTKVEEVKIEEPKKTEKLPAKKTGEPTAEQLAKIEESEKRKFEAGLAKAGLEVKKTATTPEALASRKEMLSKSLNTLDRTMKSMGEKKGTEFLENKLKVYDKYVADGGEPIGGYEILRAKLNNETEIANAEKIQQETKKEPTISSKYITLDKNTVNETKGQAFEIMEKATIVDEFLEDTLVIEPESSTLETEYNKKKSAKSIDKAIWKKLKRAFINDHEHLIEIDKENGNHELEDAYLQASTASLEGQYQVTSHQTDMGGNIIGKSVQEIANPIISLGTKAEAVFNTYANLQYDIARKQALANYEIEYADNRFPQYTLEQEKLMVEQMRKDNPELIKLAEQVFDDIRTFYKNTNKLKVEQGMLPETMVVSDEFAMGMFNISKKDLKAMRNSEGDVEIKTEDYLSALNPYYFKTERNVEWSDNPLSYNEPRIAIKGNKKLKENANKYGIMPVFDSMAHGAVNDKIALRTNNLYKKIAKDSGKGVRMQEVTKTDGSKSFIPMDNGKYSMAYYSDGKIKRAIISKDMYETIARTEDMFDMLAQSSFTKPTRAITNFRRKVLTTANPGFLVRNHLMDLQDAYLNSNYSARTYTKNYIKAVNDIAHNNTDFQKFKAIGGASGVQGFSSEKGLIRKRTTIDKTVDAVEQIASISEAIPRYTEYLCALENGKTQAEAFRESREVTVNFRKAGSIWKKLDKTGLTLFTGSASAGLNRAYQTVIGNQIDAFNVLQNKFKTGDEISLRDKKTLMRSASSLTKIALSGLLPAIANNLMYGDDEDKEFLENIPQYVRNNNYVIKVGDNGKYIAIPRGRLTAVVQLIGGFVADDTIPETDKLGISELLSFAWGNVGLTNPIDAFVGAPILDVVKNENYYGSNIYKDNDTQEVKNKKVINYLFKNYSGIIYDVYNYAVTQDENAVPVISKFYKNTNTETAYNSRYYSIKEKYENSDDPIEKLKFTSVKYDYNKYIVPLKKELEALKEQGASSKKIKAKEQEILDTYASIYSNTNDKIEDISYEKDKSTVYYRGYTYRLTEDSNGRIYYKKVS